MAEKQLIVAVEGTAALGPYWQTILSDYLDKIIRCFYGNDLSGQVDIFLPRPVFKVFLRFFTQGAFGLRLVLELESEWDFNTKGK